MKKWTARLLLICMLILPILTLASCDDAAAPPVETPPVVITPNSSDNSATPPSPSTDPESPSASKPNEIKNIILIIGDGMGLDHIAAGQLMYGQKYAFANWQFATSNTDCAYSNGLVDVNTATDSAAGATALASGQLAVRQTVGQNYKGEDVTTILDVAKTLGKSTGIVTTDALYGATPASFSAHNDSRYDQPALLDSQLASNVDLLCGHIDSLCVARQAEIAAAGYTYCDDFSEIDATLTADKAYWQLDLGGDVSVAMKAKVSLKDATLKALTFLDRDEDGFAMMIEQAHIDKFAHKNDFRGTAYSVQSLNDTVDGILEWLGDRTDTAIVITADHETGGLNVSTEKRYSTRISSVYTTSTGVRQSIYYQYTDNDHTRAKVGVFVYGIDADFSKLGYYGSQHTIKNTTVYDLLADVLVHPVEYGTRAA